MRNRKSIRLSGYDYSQNGWYFVTVCSYKRECMFGEIQNEKIDINDVGKIILNNLNELPKRFEMNIDCFVIMPNHIHMVIDSVGAHHDAPEDKGAIRESPLHKCQSTHKCQSRKRSLLSQIIGYLKMNVSKQVGIKIWQRNYYEHIIRNERELEKIRQYIKLNPTKWEMDKDNPDLTET